MSSFGKLNGYVTKSKVDLKDFGTVYICRVLIGESASLRYVARKGSVPQSRTIEAWWAWMDKPCGEIVWDLAGINLIL